MPAEGDWNYRDVRWVEVCAAYRLSSERGG